jgi:hypothetical protein
MSIDSGIFPNRLKEAQVTPLLKKNDPFLKVIIGLSAYYLYLQKISCGTPFCIFAHVLTIFSILICCFLLDK